MSVTHVFGGWWYATGAALVAVQFVMLLVLLGRLVPGAGAGLRSSPTPHHIAIRASR